MERFRKIIFLESYGLRSFQVTVFTFRPLQSSKASPHISAAGVLRHHPRQDRRNAERSLSETPTAWLRPHTSNDPSCTCCCTPSRPGPWRIHGTPDLPGSTSCNRSPSDHTREDLRMCNSSCGPTAPERYFSPR